MFKPRVKLLVQNLMRRIIPGRLVLMYHRISINGSMDPWKIAVSADNFTRHLEVLRRYANPVTMNDIVFSPKLPAKSVAITFDDGYADNLYIAKPLLNNYSIPAAFFISTGQTDSRYEFWWDELENIILSPGKLPQRLDLIVDSRKYQWELGSAAEYTNEQHLEDYQRKVWLSEKGTRLYLYYNIWKILFPLSSNHKRKLLDDISEWSGKKPVLRDTHRSLSSKELIKLSEDPQFEIGAHGVHHLNLTVQSFSAQLNEIRESKYFLQKLLTRKISSFAYPHGEYNDIMAGILKKENFGYSLTTDYGLFRTSSNKYSVPRIQVENLDENSFQRCLENWFKE